MQRIKTTGTGLFGSATFRRKKYFAIGGTLLAAAGAALFFLPVDEKMIRYTLSAGMVAVGLASLVSFLVCRIETDDEGIQYRNMFGHMRRLRWGDILQVMDEIDYGSNMLLRGEHTSIPVSYTFDRFDVLRDIILQKTGTTEVRKKAKQRTK